MRLVRIAEARAVGGDRRSECGFVVDAFDPITEAQYVPLRNRGETVLIEAYCHGVVSGGFFDQDSIERGTADRIDDFVFALSIGVEAVFPDRS